MGLGDKIGNAAQEAQGNIKEGVGEATGNEKLQVEGAGDKLGAKAGQVGENLKDAAKNVGDALSGK